MNVKEYIEKNRGRFQEELFSLIRIPSISSDPSHKNQGFHFLHLLVLT